METKGLIGLYQCTFGKSPVKLDKLPGAGSNRCYFRITEEGGNTMIGVIGTSAEENRAFYHLALSMAARHLHVPAVYAIDDCGLCILQEDLGDRSLYGFIKDNMKNGEYGEMAEFMLHQVISELPSFQFECANDNVYSLCYPTREMDRTSVMFDLNYFKYCYLKLSGLEFNELSLEADFVHLADDILSVEEQGFMYRDFQARNVMLKEGLPYYIDFQGGRKGPIYYDVASFLWQASANYSPALRSKLVDAYLESLRHYVNISRETFDKRLRLFVLFRTLQVLGAYGYRGLWERKQYFIQSIPVALRNLNELIEDGAVDAYPYLKSVAEQLVELAPKQNPQSVHSASANREKPSLHVTIYSFSYKKGIPADDSGNGGGYVFDCRSSNNPGRYDEYKQLTGLDKPVIDFLEKDGEILTFLESVYKLADFHVQRYIDRGFTHLQFAFGCTGGRHRSVYSAQHLAEHLHQKFGVSISLHHREQGIYKNLPPQPLQR